MEFAYIEGSQVINEKQNYIHPLKVYFDLANSVDAHEMPRNYVAFHLGLHCVPKK